MHITVPLWAPPHLICGKAARTPPTPGLRCGKSGFFISLFGRGASTASVQPAGLPDSLLELVPRCCCRHLQHHNQRRQCPSPAPICSASRAILPTQHPRHAHALNRIPISGTPKASKCSTENKTRSNFHVFLFYLPIFLYVWHVNTNRCLFEIERPRTPLPIKPITQKLPRLRRHIFKAT